MTAQAAQIIQAESDPHDDAGGAPKITAIIPRDDATVLGLADAGKSCQDIAHLTGVHKSTIARQLQHLRPRKTTEIYKSLRADIAAEMQRKILRRCDLRDVKVSTARDLKEAMTAWAILYDKERLERGQSTARIEIDLSARLRAALSRSGGRQEIEAEVVETSSTNDRVSGLLTNDLPNADGE